MRSRIQRRREVIAVRMLDREDRADHSDGANVDAQHDQEADGGHHLGKQALTNIEVDLALHPGLLHLGFRLQIALHIFRAHSPSILSNLISDSYKVNQKSIFLRKLAQ